MASYPGQAPGVFSLSSLNNNRQTTHIQPETLHPPSNIPQDTPLGIENGYHRPTIPRSHAFNTKQPQKRQRADSGMASNDNFREVMALLSHASAYDIEKILSYLRVSVDMSTSSMSEHHNLDVNGILTTSDYPYPQRISNHDVTGRLTQTSSLVSGLVPQGAVCVHGQPIFTPISDYYDHTGIGSFSELDSSKQSGPQIDENFYNTQLIIPSRDSVQSAGSSTSRGTSGTSKTKRSSVSTTGSRTSILSASVRPPQRTMSTSSGPSLVSATSKSRRSTQSLRKSNVASTINCSYHPECIATFTRPDSRIRHENQMHNPQQRYTCLLDTCTSSCPENCTEEYHVNPFSHTRADKFRTEHLEKVHDWGISKGEIPVAWMGNFVHEKSHWRCQGCGENLGTWHDNADGIETHYVECLASEAMVGEGEAEEEMQRDFKRLSFERFGGILQQDAVIEEEPPTEEVHTWSNEKNWG